MLTATDEQSLVSLLTLHYINTIKQDRQCTYNVTEARSCNHCCSGKAVSVTYSECVFVVLGLQHAMCICRTVICGLPASTIFFYIIS